MGFIRMTEEEKGELGNKFAEMVAEGATLAEAASMLGHKKTTLREWHTKYGHLATERPSAKCRKLMNTMKTLADSGEGKVLLRAGEIPAHLRHAADMFETLLRALGYVVE